MFSLLEDRDEIANAERALEATLCRDFKTKVLKRIGHPGRTFDTEVYTDGFYWFCSPDLSKDHPGRRFNWFGIFEDGMLQITVEINIPCEGINRGVAGFFAHDEASLIHLLHSGRIGGKSVGKGDDFLRWSNAKLITVIDSAHRERTGVLIMPTVGEGATRSLIQYIDKVAEFKMHRPP